MHWSRRLLPLVVLLIGVAPASASSPPRYTVARNPQVAIRASQVHVVAPGARGVIYLGDAWSRDAGRTWAASPFVSDANASYGFSHAKAGLVYRFTNGGTFRSTDYGRTWQRRADPAAGGDETWTYVDPVNGNVVCQDGASRGGSGGSSLSTDGGASWTLTQNCNSIASADSSTLVETQPDAPIVRVSSDGGATWTDTPTDLPAGNWFLVGDPSTPHSLYAWTGDDPDYTRQPWSYHSADGGLHWTAITVPPGLTNLPSTELADPSRPGVLVLCEAGQLWISRDGGASWTLTPRRLPACPDGFDASGALYVLSASPMRSTNDGVSWTWRGAGLHGVIPSSLAVDASTGAISMLSTGGLLRLSADGRTWASRSPYGSSESGVDQVASSFAALHGSIVFPLFDGFRLVRSANDGTSFGDAAPPGSNLASLDQYATLTALGRSSTLLVLTPGETYTSVDAGATWTAEAVLDPSANGYSFYGRMTVLQGAAPSQAVMLTEGTTGAIWRSTDLGLSWQPWVTVPENLFVTAATPKALYLVNSAVGGLAVLTAGAAAPRSVHELARITVDHVATSFAHPALAVATGTDATGGARVYATRDAGTTWTRLATPIPSGCSTRDAALTPSGRLVLALAEPAPDAPTAACPVASILSTPLT
ncbi:MAG: hypothetical protein ABI317_13615 [Gaiellales bacterium]